MSTKKKVDETLTGRLRMSAAMLGAGPGALLDMTDDSVMIAGLDAWGSPLTPGGSARFREVRDRRLQGYVQRFLGAPEAVRMFQPTPAEEREGRASLDGLRAWRFPEWFVTQVYADPARSHGATRSRPLVHWKSLDKDGAFRVEHEDPRTGRRSAEKVPVVPVRFVRACVNGHIEDLDWEGFAHPNLPRCRRPGALRLEERGTSGDLAELFVVCTHCKGAEQSLVRATEFNPEKGCTALGFCRGAKLWLGRGLRDDCRDDAGKRTPSKLLVRSATNAWFPAVLSALTLPPKHAARSPARAVVDALWDDLFAQIEDAAELRFARKLHRETLADFTDEALLAACAQRRQEAAAPAAEGGGPKAPELETFLGVDGVAGEDVMGSAFFAESSPPPARRGPGARPFIDRVLLVHRLREVRALVGFTRFEAPLPTVDGELDLAVRPAPLATHRQWVPAVENQGEGVFLSLDAERVRRWAFEDPAVDARRAQLRAGFARWKQERGADDSVPFLELPYVLLHGLAHLLITAVSLECGYPSSSIRERVYVGSRGYGVLLYTSTPDAEGTLGGLVATGRQLERHINAALEVGRLCANDPVCAHHMPESASGAQTLQGAACHGCLLIAETSCERQNTWLDRAVVVPTVADRDAAFFKGW